MNWYWIMVRIYFCLELFFIRKINGIGLRLNWSNQKMWLATFWSKSGQWLHYCYLFINSFNCILRILGTFLRRVFILWSKFEIIRENTVLHFCLKHLSQIRVIIFWPFHCSYKRSDPINSDPESQTQKLRPKTHTY